MSNENILNRKHSHKYPTGKVSCRGQICIPLKVREALGIQTDDILAFDVQNGKLVAKKIIVEKI